ncbi:phage portal protein [Bradyrhizobium paxllaeri]|uniref:phage portal protein n=1 Tax=Bradyrhizobium paxllaeri TaxID=190148 RepID=UPI000810C334|nr:phage portal protein [Bradyrhizobium paxllaeri]
MNIFDRVIAAVSPERGLRRARARAAIRVYEGAMSDRRSTNWKPKLGSSANSDIGWSLGPLRDRARHLVQNTTHAPRAIDIIVNNAVGTGIMPVPRTGSDGLDNRVTKLWEEWQKSADAEGMLTFNAMQQLALRSIIQSGEVLCRFVETGPNSSGRVPLKLQLLESDLIDHGRDGLFVEGEGLTRETKRSRLGVGLGDFDVRTGVWLHPSHPGDNQTPESLKKLQSTFFKRDQVLHVFRPLRPGQVRGVTWFAPMLAMARDFNDFLDASLVKARVEACFSGFIENEEQLGPVLDTAFGGAPQQDGAVVSNLEPGTITQLRPGQTIKFATPSGAGQFDPVMKMCLYAMSSAIGVTYDQLTSDLTGANYSSLRAGKLEFYGFIAAIQEGMFIPQFCQVIWERFIERAILAGMLRRRSGGYPCDWVTPTWLAINPAVDNEADAQAVRDGRMSYQEFCAKWGVDWRKQIRDRAEFNKEVDKEGVILDIDSRQRTRAGGAVPMQKEPGAPPNENEDADNAADEDAEDADTGLNGKNLMNGGANGAAAARAYLRNRREADHDGRPFPLH